MTNEKRGSIFDLEPRAETTPSVVGFQACVGPSLTKVHIRDKGQPLGLTLCERTAVVQDYRANVPAVKLCQACCRKLGGDISARLIGVRAIT